MLWPRPITGAPRGTSSDCRGGGSKEGERQGVRVMSGGGAAHAVAKTHHWCSQGTSSDCSKGGSYKARGEGSRGGCVVSVGGATHAVAKAHHWCTQENKVRLQR